MTLTEFIQKLQSLEPEAGGLPVCLADWSEQYKNASEEAAEVISIQTATTLEDEGNAYYPKSNPKQIVLIGDDGEVN